MTNHVDPTRAAFDAFKALPRDRPIHMLNLLLYRDEAHYPEGHHNAGKGWTGREAYAEYGRTSEPIFRRVGGSVVWRGIFQNMLTGPEKQWHDGFIAAYPHAGAFLEMVTDPEYQKAVINRQAAVQDSRLIRFSPGEAGGGFG
ncbi:DUF1330 domain-containing protein [Pseudopontixanthobacter vadosimaris]|uniref:DUF1330 domain-containing protein n=1 Tax=Pseudopontixanthobacter vadosimaris TaxID=2726450 RepID=UPI001472E4B4